MLHDIVVSSGRAEEFFLELEEAWEEEYPDHPLSTRCINRIPKDYTPLMDYTPLLLSRILVMKNRNFQMC